MEEKTDQIIKYIDNTREVQTLKSLTKEINNNQNYLKLMKQFIDNKDKYVKNNIYEQQIIKLRKKLFEIKEIKEYLNIQNKLRLLSMKINNIILSILD